MIISTLSVILSSEIMTVAVNFSDQNDVLLGHIYQKQPNVVVFDAQISIEGYQRYNSTKNGSKYHFPTLERLFSCLRHL